MFSSEGRDHAHQSANENVYAQGFPRTTVWSITNLPSQSPVDSCGSSLLCRSSIFCSKGLVPMTSPSCSLIVSLTLCQSLQLHTFQGFLSAVHPTVVPSKSKANILNEWRLERLPPTATNDYYHIFRSAGNYNIPNQQYTVTTRALDQISARAFFLRINESSLLKNSSADRKESASGPF